MREHGTTVRHWERVGTYQAMCSCGWRAEWPHTSREAAHEGRGTSPGVAPGTGQRVIVGCVLVAGGVKE